MKTSDDQDRADHQAERLRHADPAGHGGPLPDRDVVGDGGAQAGVLAVLEGAEQHPEDRHADHRRLVPSDHQADGAEQGHGERPAVPAAAQPAQAEGVGGPVGQRPGHRRGQHRGDGAERRHDGERQDLVRAG